MSRASTIDLLVFDTATIRFRWGADQTMCVAVSPRGESLAVRPATPAQADLRVLAFELFDAALETGQVLRPHPSDPTQRISYRIGLYNPHSGDVSVGSIPTTLTFGDERPLVITSDGLVAAVHTDDQGTRLQAGRTLPLREPTSLTRMSRLVAAHSG